jgi:prepilin-type N-terminal cleavage/methylation domain-containing protein
MPKHKSSQDGFTLVELLLVVMLIGVMAGSLVSLINYTQHRKNAQDAIMRVNMDKLVTGIESYRTLEGRYPSDTNGDGDPSDDTRLTEYIRGGWLNNAPVGAVYVYSVNSTRDDAGIMVTLNSGKKIKYRTEWGMQKECVPTTVVTGTDC